MRLSLSARSATATLLILVSSHIRLRRPTLRIHHPRRLFLASVKAACRPASLAKYAHSIPDLKRNLYVRSPAGTPFLQVAEYAGKSPITVPRMP